MRNGNRHLRRNIAKVQRRKQHIAWVELKVKRRKLLSVYGKSLVLKIATAKYIDRAEMVGGNWQPQPNVCHDNVTEYCQFNQKFKPARGWLFFDFSSCGYYKFLAHSVLKFPDGKLRDITPSNASTDYPFIHGGLEEAAFFATVAVSVGGEINVPVKNTE